MNKNTEKYEWLDEDGELVGDKDKVARELMGSEFAEGYVTPIREYDESVNADETYISSLPDLQNGPSSLIQGSKVEIQQVGIHNFRLPITYATRGGKDIQLETSVTGSVSLEAHKKGINMSRIMRSFYKFKDEVFDFDVLNQSLNMYTNDIGSFDARIMLSFSYPMIQKSLRSGNEGYQYYDVTFEGDLSKDGGFRPYMHFDFVYSSACPCSYELSQHAEKYRNRAVVPHSQRSVARCSILMNQDIWIEELQEMCVKALATETQVMVKREDEQAFAELNGSNLKFVEDAARLLHEQLDGDKRIDDFKIIASHNESLHSHNAIAAIVKGIPGGFRPGVPRDCWQSLGLR